MPKSKIVRMSKIQATEVSIATNTEVSDLDCMWANISYRRRPNQKTITIKLDTASIIVVMKTPLNCVTLANEILPKYVGDINVLMTSVEGIEAAIRVLLEH